MINQLFTLFTALMLFSQIVAFAQNNNFPSNSGDSGTIQNPLHGGKT